MEPLAIAAAPEGLSFGALLRSCRHRAGLSQEELATRAGLSERTIRNLETGRVRAARADTARLLADALHLTGPELERFMGEARQDRIGVWSESTTVMTAPGAPGVARMPRNVPAQLPLNVNGFVGRNAELARLDAILAETTDEPAAVVISALSGTAGVGKTALAVHWAHRVRGRFPGGQLHANLRGFDASGSVLNPAAALRGFLDALDVPPERIPASLDGQAALYRTLLADRRVLVVLDNARDAEHVRPLLPGAPGCLVVVTSRDQLTSLVATEGAHPLSLDLLNFSDARLRAWPAGPLRRGARPCPAVPQPAPQGRRPRR
jgi:transcriptional regulator with XRE-family HTH domain